MVDYREGFEYTCRNGCLKIKSAMLSCSEKDYSNQKDHSLILRRRCNDKSSCTAKACEDTFGPIKPCANEVKAKLYVEMRCDGVNSESNWSKISSENAGCRPEIPTLDCPATGKILKGAIYRKIKNISSVKQCYERCKERWQCTYYSYRARSKNCRLIREGVIKKKKRK